MSVSINVLLVLEPPRTALSAYLHHELFELVCELRLVLQPAHRRDLRRPRNRRRSRRCHVHRRLRDLMDDLLDEPQPVRHRERPDFLDDWCQRSHRRPPETGQCTRWARARTRARPGACRSPAPPPSARPSGAPTAEATSALTPTATSAAASPAP